MFLEVEVHFKHGHESRQKIFTTDVLFGVYTNKLAENVARKERDFRKAAFGGWVMTEVSALWSKQHLSVIMTTW